MLAARPTMPKISMIPDATSGGANNRWTPSTRMKRADRQQDRRLHGGGEHLGPQVAPRRRVGGRRRASQAAASAMTSPAASVSMCPASASSARLPVTAAPITSTTSTLAVIPEHDRQPAAVVRRPRRVGVGVAVRRHLPDLRLAALPGALPRHPPRAALPRGLTMAPTLTRRDGDRRAARPGPPGPWPAP